MKDNKYRTYILNGEEKEFLSFDSLEKVVYAAFHKAKHQGRIWNREVTYQWSKVELGNVEAVLSKHLKKIEDLRKRNSSGEMLSGKDYLTCINPLGACYEISPA